MCDGPEGTSRPRNHSRVDAGWDPGKDIATLRDLWTATQPEQRLYIANEPTGRGGELCMLPEGLSKVVSNPIFADWTPFNAKVPKHAVMLPCRPRHWSLLPQRPSSIDHLLVVRQE